MANDIDMWNDLKIIEKKKKRHDEYLFLWSCYMAKFIDNNDIKAHKLKINFKLRFGWWGNYF